MSRIRPAGMNPCCLEHLRTAGPTRPAENQNAACPECNTVAIYRHGAWEAAQQLPQGEYVRNP